MYSVYIYIILIKYCRWYVILLFNNSSSKVEIYMYTYHIIYSTWLELMFKFLEMSAVEVVYQPHNYY